MIITVQFEYLLRENHSLRTRSKDGWSECLEDQDKACLILISLFPLAQCFYLYSFCLFSGFANECEKEDFWYRHFFLWKLYRRTQRINISIQKSNKLLVSSETCYRLMPSTMRMDCVVMRSNNPALNYSYGRFWCWSEENDTCLSPASSVLHVKWIVCERKTIKISWYVNFLIVLWSPPFPQHLEL